MSSESGWHAGHHHLYDLLLAWANSQNSTSSAVKSVLLQEGEKKAAAARKRQRKDKDKEGKATDAKPKRAKVCASAPLPIAPSLTDKTTFLYLFL